MLKYNPRGQLQLYNFNCKFYLVFFLFFGALIVFYLYIIQLSQSRKMLKEIMISKEKKQKKNSWQAK